MMMAVKINTLWHVISGRRNRGSQAVEPTAGSLRQLDSVMPIDIAPDDPLINQILNSQGLVEIDKLNFRSPALEALKSSGIKITVPLINQGELIGLLNLGSRLSEQEYSTDDYRLLSNLATQSAPALRVAQLARRQQAEYQNRERLEQELRVARVIQQTLLPKATPDIPGWEMAAFWQPARAVGGDFYDFIPLVDGRIGLVIGDVTDKGVPAALVMATTRSILRAAAERLSSPGQVLQRANNLLYGEIPENMFATCQYIILDPANGSLIIANAGHNLPIHRSAGGVQELHATGMPLGLLPNMSYEEKQAVLRPGESILFYSDGLVEAHNPAREMFGIPALRELIAHHPGGGSLIPHLLDELRSFTGEDWDQEDDVTLLSLKFKEVMMPYSPAMNSSGQAMEGAGWQALAEFQLPSEPGNERRAMQLVADVASQALSMSSDQMEKLKTAVAEATMNAMEHGNKYQPDLLVKIQVLSSGRAVKVRIFDQGGATPIPETKDPDLDAKLAGLQSPRGWGLFLIKNMVDEMHIYGDDSHHIMELILYLSDGGVDD